MVVLCGGERKALGLDGHGAIPGASGAVDRWERTESEAAREKEEGGDRWDRSGSERREVIWRWRDSLFEPPLSHISLVYLLWCVVGKGIFSWCASDKITECNVLHTKPCFVSVLGTNFLFLFPLLLRGLISYRRLGESGGRAELHWGRSRGRVELHEGAPGRSERRGAARRHFFFSFLKFFLETFSLFPLEYVHVIAPLYITQATKFNYTCKVSECVF
jgi:hypothetical protein